MFARSVLAAEHCWQKRTVAPSGGCLPPHTTADIQYHHQRIVFYTPSRLNNCQKVSKGLQAAAAASRYPIKKLVNDHRLKVLQLVDE